MRIHRPLQVISLAQNAVDMLARDLSDQTSTNSHEYHLVVQSVRLALKRTRLRLSCHD